jgi:hypothetical protein
MTVEGAPPKPILLGWGFCFELTGEDALSSIDTVTLTLSSRLPDCSAR